MNREQITENKKDGQIFIRWLNVMPLILLFSFLDAQQFGIGIIIGSPTGFSGKILMAQRAALSFNIGWDLGDKPRLHINGDYQFLFPGIIHWEDDMTQEKKEIKDLIPFLGIGGRFKFKESEQEEVEMNIGLRIGGGAEYMIAKFGIFLEIYPVVNILPATDFDLEGGLGARFYF